tara:strand:+ start:182 stop:319 length:138 start_codon:yes stop_codon:yes gene_type:complete
LSEPRRADISNNEAPPSVEIMNVLPNDNVADKKMEKKKRAQEWLK